MTLGKYIPKIATLQATPIVDPDTGMASPMFMLHLQAIMDRIGGSANLPLTTYTNPQVANSASGISGTAPALTVGAATTATTATTAAQVTGGTQNAVITWSFQQTFTLAPIAPGYKVGATQVLTSQQTGLGTTLTPATAGVSYTATEQTMLQNAYNKILALETKLKIHGMVAT